MKRQHRPILRGYVREYLSLVPRGRRATVAMVTAGVSEILPPHHARASEEEISSAIAWLHDQGEIEFRHNPEMERDEWFLR